MLHAGMSSESSLEDDTSKSSSLEEPSDSIHDQLISDLCSNEGAAEYPESLAVAHREILMDLSLINNDNTTLTKEEKQALLDELFPVIYFKCRLNPVLMSKFLARIWVSSQLIPSQLLGPLQGVLSVSLHPFATTESSNIYEGLMMDDTSIALKTFRRTQARPPSKTDLERFFFEAMVSSIAPHRNIMPILGIHVSLSNDIYLISKLETRGSLPEYLAAYPETDKILILKKLADAIAHLHGLPTPILHGDIRGMNVLMDSNGEPLLMDFGFSLVQDLLTKSFIPRSHHFIGNPRWTPGEKIHQTEFPLTLKADSFSFASLILEVLSNDIPYSYIRNNSAVIIELIVHQRTPRRPDSDLLTDSLWNLMNTCWSRNPSNRPSMEEIRDHFASVCSEQMVVPLS